MCKQVSPFIKDTILFHGEGNRAESQYECMVRKEYMTERVAVKNESANSCV